MADEPKFTVRRGEASDADAIVAFNAAMARETEGRELDEQRLARGVRRVIEDARHGFYLVATDEGGRMVGQLMITHEWSDWRDSVFWWIQSVYVHPDHRRQGVYRALHALAEKLARKAGACGLRLYVERENVAAQATYRRLGMARTRYEMFEVELD